MRCGLDIPSFVSFIFLSANQRRRTKLLPRRITRHNARTKGRGPPFFFLGEVCGGGAGHVLAGHFTFLRAPMCSTTGPLTVLVRQGSAQPCTPSLFLLVSRLRCPPSTVRSCTFVSIAQSLCLQVHCMAPSVSYVAIMMYSFKHALCVHSTDPNECAILQASTLPPTSP